MARPPRRAVAQTPTHQPARCGGFSRGPRPGRGEGFLRTGTFLMYPGGEPLLTPLQRRARGTAKRLKVEWEKRRPMLPEYKN
eukprot:563764-Pleurochrysis_carterae.AAC.1